MKSKTPSLVEQMRLFFETYNIDAINEWYQTTYKHGACMLLLDTIDLASKSGQIFHLSRKGLYYSPTDSDYEEDWIEFSSWSLYLRLGYVRDTHKLMVSAVYEHIRLNLELIEDVTAIIPELKGGSSSS